MDIAPIDPAGEGESPEGDDLLVEDDLVDEVSIDGMCGVY